MNGASSTTSASCTSRPRAVELPRKIPGAPVPSISVAVSSWPSRLITVVPTAPSWEGLRSSNVPLGSGSPPADSVTVGIRRAISGPCSVRV